MNGVVLSRNDSIDKRSGLRLSFLESLSLLRLFARWNHRAKSLGERRGTAASSMRANRVHPLLKGDFYRTEWPLERFDIESIRRYDGLGYGMTLESDNQTAVSFCTNMHRKCCLVSRSSPVLERAEYPPIRRPRQSLPSWPEFDRQPFRHGQRKRTDAARWGLSGDEIAYAILNGFNPFIEYQDGRMLWTQRAVHLKWLRVGDPI